MHSPGICGVILASGSDTEAPAQVAALGGLIDALSDCDLVLVALGANSGALAPAVWAHAAYVVQLAAASSDADALRATLREVLNRGRDAALVAFLNDQFDDDPKLNRQALHAETVQRMVAAYCAAGDEIWAVVPESEMLQGHPVLMGRKMIEVFLRGGKWSAPDEILSANLEHVLALKATDASAATAAPAATWKAPWD